MQSFPWSGPVILPSYSSACVEQSLLYLKVVFLCWIVRFRGSTCPQSCFPPHLIIQVVSTDKSLSNPGLPDPKPLSVGYNKLLGLERTISDLLFLLYLVNWPKHFVGHENGLFWGVYVFLAFICRLLAYLGSWQPDDSCLWTAPSFWKTFSDELQYWKEQIPPPPPVHVRTCVCVCVYD